MRVQRKKTSLHKTARQSRALRDRGAHRTAARHVVIVRRDRIVTPRIKKSRPALNYAILG